MKPLPTEFKKGEFTHKLVRREGNAAIYWRKAPHHRDAHYEVVVIQQQKAYSRFGKDYPAAEHYPPSEEWGTNAWTYNRLEDAELRFAWLCNGRVRSAEPRFQRL